MGFKLKKIELSGCDTIKPNEEKDLVIELEKENRAAIHGVVRFPSGRPVKNAIVKLFMKKDKDCCDLIPVTFAFTDECGQFLFGVDSGKEFVIKVFFFKPERPSHSYSYCDEKDCDDDRGRKDRKGCKDDFED
jgi:hypothetical protein